MNDKIENLRKWKFLEEYRSKACLDASCTLEDVNNELANELYDLHKLHFNNALECDKLLVEYDEWIKDCDMVINEIENGDD